MKKTIFLMLFAFILTSCSDNSKKVAIKVAEEYVKDNILSFFPSSEIVDKYPGMVNLSGNEGPLVTFTTDALVQAKITNIAANSLLDMKERYAKYSDMTEEHLREKLVFLALKQSSIDALKIADSKEGYYTVVIAIKYDAEEYHTVDIIVSKNLKVLNPVVDTKSIDETVKTVFN